MTSNQSLSWLRKINLERLETRDVPAPLAVGDQFTGAEDLTLSVNAPGVLNNDSGSGVLSATLITPPERGNLDFRADGSFDYQPEADFNGAIVFDYELTDANSQTARASVTIDVTPVNDAPVANDHTVFTDADTEVEIDFPAFDVDGDSLSIGIESQPENGELFFLENGVIVYQPASGFVGTDTLTYVVFDDETVSSPATVTIVVGGASNSPPVAEDDYFTVGSGSELIVDAPGVLSNDSDPDSDSLVAYFDAGPSHGVVTLATDGSFSYTPDAGFVGVDSFTYFADDGQGGSSLGRVEITVTASNSSPVVEDASVSTNEDQSVSGAIAGSDADGDQLTYSTVVEPAHGTVVVHSDGSFTYIPNANYFGTDTFSVVAHDGTTSSNVATVTVTIEAVNDAPTLSNANFNVAENSPNGTVVGTIGGADIEGDALSYAIVGGNTNGAFAIDPVTGVITVANSAEMDFETQTQFPLTIQVTDAGGLTATATATVQLTNVSESPVVRIDIKPHSNRNRIRLSGRDTVSVAILSSADFDARTVNISSLRFGRTGMERSLETDRRGRPEFTIRDVNRDGLPDLVVNFDVDKTRFRVGTTEGVLTGLLNDGTAFRAVDRVQIRR